MNLQCYVFQSHLCYVYVTRCIEKYILFLCPVNYILWNYIWGNSLHSEEIFKVQKRIIRIIMNFSKNASCRQPFKELNVLPVPSQYILSVLLFLTKNEDQFMTNSQMHKITTRQTFDLYIPVANLTVYQKGVLLPRYQDLQPFTKNY